MDTLATLIDRHGIDVLEHLDRALDVPVYTSLQLQGDVAVVPLADMPVPRATVPADGVVLVKAANSGNTHTLLADGDVTCRRDVARNLADLAIARVRVAPGATAYVAHAEHGYLGIGPGLYEIRRQREFADEIRVVAD